MELRIYRDERQLFQDYRAYDHGDMQAGQRVGREIAASGGRLQLRDVARAARLYATSQTPQARRYEGSTQASQEEVYKAGVYLHNDAVKILRAGMQQNYSAALKDALILNPCAASTYAGGVKLASDSVERLKKHSEYLAVARQHATSAVVELNNRISGWKTPDGIGLDA